MYIKINNIEPKYEKNDITSETISVSGYANDNSGDYINGRITINKASDLTGDETLDNLNNTQITNLSLKKMTAYIKEALDEA